MLSSSEPETSQLEDYSNVTVPEHQTINGWRVALVVVGINVGLATFLNGAHVSSGLGLYDALFCAFVAGIILCVMGTITSLVSVRSRLTTYKLVQYSFGVKGAVIVNLILAIIHLGWFGVNASFFGSAMVASIREVYQVEGPLHLIIIVGSFLMAITTIYGFRAINRLSAWAIPILLGIFVTVFVMSISRYGLVTADPTPVNQMSFGLALSSLVGSNLLTVAAMPDLSRFIRNNRQAFYGMLMSFPVAIPGLLFLAAVPTLATGEIDIMVIITGFGLGLPALVILVMSTWTANSVNLYSSSLSLTATFKAIPPWKFTVAGALLGAGFALLGIIESFIPFLLLLGVIIPPIAAVYVIDCYTLFKSGYSEEILVQGPAVRWSGIVTWLISVTVALSTYAGLFTLTSAPALDATIVASVVHLLLNKKRT